MCNITAGVSFDQQSPYTCQTVILHIKILFVILHEDIMKKGEDHATLSLLICGHTSSSGMAMNSTMGSRVNGVRLFGFRL